MRYEHVFRKDRMADSDNDATNYNEKKLDPLRAKKIFIRKKLQPIVITINTR